MELRLQRDMKYTGGSGGNIADMTSFVEVERLSLIKAQLEAKKAHDSVNQLYDGQNYFDTHIMSAYQFGEKYIYLLPFDIRTVVLKVVLFHDVLEDVSSVTYNDLYKKQGLFVAEGAYACTNDKGRTRKERAGSNYYKGIRSTPFATYVKLCDRFANVTYSKSSGSNMFFKYRDEHSNFIASLKGTNTWFGKLRYWFEGVFDLHEADYEVMYADLNNLVYNESTPI